jgi:hypothetical protein
MSDGSSVAKSLRDRLGGNTEERLGRALSDLLENPLLTGAIGRAFDAREKASQAQEVAMGALNIPSAADIERLTRRLRAVSQRLEGIEDGVHRLDRALAPTGVEARLSAIEERLENLTSKLGMTAARVASAASARRTTATAAGKAKPAGKRKAAAKAAPARKAKAAAKAKPASKAKAAGRAKPASKAKAAGKAKQGGNAKAAGKSKAAGKRKAARKPARQGAAKAAAKAKPARKAKPKRA